LGAAKVAVFAYKRTTHEPYWQSGIARSSSTSRDTWFLGIGPWQAGTIYEGTRFAGGRTSRIWGLPSNKAMPRGPSYEEFRGVRLFAAAIENEKKAEPVDGGSETRVAQAGAPASTTPAPPAPAGTAPAPPAAAVAAPAATAPAPSAAPTAPPAAAPAIIR